MPSLGVYRSEDDKVSIMTRPDDDSDRARVYNQLKAMAVGYRFRPREQLMIGELADRLRVSSTPVREALIRLQAQALLDTAPERGFFANTLNLKEMVDLVRFRFVILTSSIEQAMHRFNGGVAMANSLVPRAGGESDIVSRVAAMGERPLNEPDDFVRHVEEVSARIAALSENHVMMCALDNANDRTHYVRTIDLEDRRRRGDVQRSFQKLSLALQRNDTAAASAVLKGDLDKQIDRMPALVKEGISRAYASSWRERSVRSSR